MFLKIVKKDLGLVGSGGGGGVGGVGAVDSSMMIDGEDDEELVPSIEELSNELMSEIQNIVAKDNTMTWL